MSPQMHIGEWDCGLGPVILTSAPCSRAHFSNFFSSPLRPLGHTLCTATSVHTSTTTGTQPWPSAPSALFPLTTPLTWYHDLPDHTHSHALKCPLNLPSTPPGHTRGTESEGLGHFLSTYRQHTLTAPYYDSLNNTLSPALKVPPCPSAVPPPYPQRCAATLLCNIAQY